MRGIALATLIVVMMALMSCGRNDTPAPATTEVPAVATTAATPASTENSSDSTGEDSSSGAPADTEQEYLTFFLAITEDYAAAFRTFSDLNQRAGENTDLLLDADWVREAQAATTDIEELSQRILDYENVPERFAPAHAKLETAADKFKQAMSLYRDGLDTIDVDSTTQAFSLIGEGTGIVQEATQEIAGLIGN